MANTIYADDAPVKQVAVTNEDGYWDLLLTKSYNGEAIRIANRFNSERVHITLDQVDDLISALEQVRDNGLSMSVHSTQYDKPTIRVISQVVNRLSTLLADAE
jgi:hypothetical protein